MIAGITVDFRAGLACPAINRPVADDDVVFVSAERLVRMNSREFMTLARRRRQAPQDLLHEILKAAVTAAQRVLDQEGSSEEVRGKVLRLLRQGEVLPGGGGELVFDVLV
ncbi:MAG: hypothetical protein BroJett006_27490 [Betaproteobacteria bacterium]|nr:MAG: hypothetical protein BroJett006_27490 [Betaproteobacteria bacterium]